MTSGHCRAWGILMNEKARPLFWPYYRGVRKLAGISLRDALWIHPCTLDGRIPAADGHAS